ncbi:MAG: HAMP domain-containing sensor histidine kinase, partial [Candidatus Dormiibacterota bacterium]
GGPPAWVRRLGCFAGCALLFLVAAVTAVVWLLLSALGTVRSSPVLTGVLGAVVLLGVLALLALVRVLRTVAAPVGGLVDAARRVESGDYSSRVPIRGPGQVRSLARAFNAMSARLEADQTRRRSVLADIAHELRTPLTIIRSQAEAIADGVNPADPEHIAPIVTATRALEALADDLRTLTLTEAGGLRLEREPVEVSVLVSETLDAFRADAGAAGVQLLGRVVPDTPAVDGDPARLRRILGNLLSNALAHTLRGGTITCTARGEDGTVRIEVSDDGEGIPAALLPRVFDRFVKGPGSTGSGLGLAIVRDLVEAHGGTVTVDSAEGRGATFRITLPRAVAG